MSLKFPQQMLLKHSNDGEIGASPNFRVVSKVNLNREDLARIKVTE